MVRSPLAVVLLFAINLICIGLYAIEHPGKLEQELFALLGVEQAFQFGQKQPVLESARRSFGRVIPDEGQIWRKIAQSRMKGREGRCQTVQIIATARKTDIDVGGLDSLSEIHQA